MKKIILSISLITFCLNILNSQETPSDFDYKLSNIVHSFRNEIMNKDECENLKRDTEDLVDEIEEAIAMDDEYTNYEIRELKNLKREAEAVEGIYCFCWRLWKLYSKYQRVQPSKSKD